MPACPDVKSHSRKFDLCLPLRAYKAMAKSVKYQCKLSAVLRRLSQGRLHLKLNEECLGKVAVVCRLSIKVDLLWAILDSDRGIAVWEVCDSVAVSQCLARGWIRSRCVDHRRCSGCRRSGRPADTADAVSDNVIKSLRQYILISHQVAGTCSPCKGQ